MTVHRPDPEAHARALRVAARDALLDELMSAAGVVLDEAPITQPIPIVRRAEERVSWLSAG